MNTALWKTSSFTSHTGECVEACAAWVTSTRSSSAPEPSCVEVAPGNTVRVQDTKDRERAMVTVSAHAWTALLEGLGEQP